MTDRQTVESLFPFFDSIPSPVEYEAILARTTPSVRDDQLVVTVESMERSASEGTLMDIEENVAIE
jgi:hypothetical protein